jgi:hemoglobin
MAMVRWLRRWGPPLIAVAVTLATALGGAVGADEGPLDRKALNDRVVLTFRDVINKGADMYNSGDWAGCYHLYEGALMAVRPLLDHKPALQKDIDAALADAGREPVVWQRAVVLRRVIDRMRTDLSGGKIAPPPTKTAWDRFGGEAGVRKAVIDFIAAAGNDASITYFKRPENKERYAQEKYAPLVNGLVDLISQVTGGPKKYAGPDLAAAYLKDTGVTEAELDALQAHFAAALKKTGAPKADVDELLAAVDKARKGLDLKPSVEPKTTLYERLGKEAGIAKVVEDFYSTAVADKKVNFWRTEGYVPKPVEVTKVKEGLITWFADKAGGPKKYAGKSMKDAHKDMKITEDEFAAALGHLEAALKKNMVKDADAKAVLAVAEATRLDIVTATKPQDATVRGKVTYKGLPVAAGTVTVHVEGTKRNAQIKDGSFEVAGLKPGKWAVTVESKVGDASLLPEKYADPKTSPLIVDAKPGLTPLDLTLEDGK